MTTPAPIAIIGLGYVGLPLAVEFARTRPVIGFDTDPARISALRAGDDSTREVAPAELAAVPQLTFTSDPTALSSATIFIVTVPTPVDAHKRPDLTPLLTASATVGAALKPGDTVIYESTVYPGATEDDCVPVLEAASGLTFNRDFTCGYSPERINPGDTAHRLPSIVKVTSGSTPEAAAAIDALYASIITAGTYRAPSIRVAEAAKVIENTQRDLNIALVNELAIIFDRMGLDTQAVLETAGTKWNFLPFRPGLVGGHCIGVDPYYLTHRAEIAGYRPEVILAGRRINDEMGPFIARETVRRLAKKGGTKSFRVSILGLTFKENVPDVRNTKVIDIIEELDRFGARVRVHDPLADADEVKHEFGLELADEASLSDADAVILAVPHETYLTRGWGWISDLLAADDGLVVDVRARLSRDARPAEIDLWRL